LFALNTVDAQTTLTPLVATAIGWQGRSAALEPRPSDPIWPWLLGAAALLAALDGIAVLALSGRFRRPLAQAASLLLVAALSLPAIDPAGAQDIQAEMEKALAGTTDTQIGYVLTGDAQVDETSRAGLQGLSMYLAERTALEPGDPAPLDIATDELAFYALIYWPVSPAQPVPTAATMAKVEAFLKNGGTILFDTRDAGGFNPTGFGASTPENQKLREILSFVDVPPLEPVPPDHVLTKAFYLLTSFPGRWDNSELVGRDHAGCRPGSRDARCAPATACRRSSSPATILAAAWAIDAGGPVALPDGARRPAAARTGVPGRSEHRDVFADRQLQGRPGACAGAA
jgi:hypothetical protein